MNNVEELRLHVDALTTVIEQDTSFFSSIQHYVKQFQKILHSPTDRTSLSEIDLFSKKIEQFYQKWRPSNTPGSLYIPPQVISNSDPTVGEINQLVSKLLAIGEDGFKEMLMDSGCNISVQKTSIQTENCVFIGHGRSRLWARVKIFLEDEIGIPTISFESESHVGESIIPILERMLDQSTFAILILTAEDETAGGLRRARQNVIHEAGLFQGRLGFKKAVLLRQEGLEGFTNVDGLQYIGFTGDQVEQTFYELRRVLKREDILA